MTDYVSVTLNSKVAFSVHKKAFIEIINTIPKKINDVQVINSKTDISISIDGKKFSLYLEVKISDEIKIANKINEIKNYLETHSMYLVDSKPLNIIINCVSRY